MKKTFFLLVLVAFTTFAQAQAINNFFDKFANDERFSYTKIGKAMQTLTLEITPSNAKFADSMEKEILDIMKKENYVPTVESREKGERSYIYSKPAKDEKKDGEMVIINRDKSEINILWILGGNKNNKFMKEFQKYFP